MIMQARRSQLSEMDKHHDVIVIGAGVGGLYQIKRLADLSVDAINQRAVSPIN